MSKDFVSFVVIWEYPDAHTAKTLIAIIDTVSFILHLLSIIDEQVKPLPFCTDNITSVYVS